MPTVLDIRLCCVVLGALALSTGAHAEAASGEAPGGRSFVFGSEAGSEASSDQARGTGLSPDPGWRVRLDRAHVEAGFLGSRRRPADTSHDLNAVVSASRSFGERWDVKLGARLDGQLQRGDRRVSELDLAYEENWVRYRAEDWRFTAGLQKVLWGRTDELAPTDRMSRKDLRRFALDDMADRRRATPALRLEWFHEEWTVDMLWLPSFRSAVLPDRDSMWHPVDQYEGRLLGLPTDPAFSALVENGRFSERDSGGSGGAGVRVSRSTRGLDYAFTVQRTRHSQPYYELDETVRRTLLSTGDPATALASATGDTFRARHPFTWVVGGDAGFVTGAWTWRAEAAWLSHVPVTRNDLSFDTVSGFDWAVGAETFPGDRDMRLTVQVAGMHLLGTRDVINERSRYFVNGEIEDFFAQHRWRGRLRFSYGIGKRDVYLNPELAWIGSEPHELYVGFHWMDGEDDALGGFYRSRRMLTLGWRGRF